MEEWAKKSIFAHNILMQIAWQIVSEANNHCSNSQSERLEEELNNYEVLPDGTMKTGSNDEVTK